MVDPLVLIVLVVVAALLFDFANGWNDAANAIATVVSTRVLSPLAAVLLAGGLNFVGAYLSTKVAKTIGGSLVDPTMISMTVILAAMLGAFLWTFMMTRVGMPISGSHSLIGGLLGAVVFAKGFSVLKMGGVYKVLTALLLSPIFGLGVGFLFMVLIMHLCKNVAPSIVNKYFGKLQLISVSFMALSHGTNDAQKVMGIITMALLSGGFIDTLEVPFWVITACALMMGLGTATGGWRVIKTLGLQLSKIKPVHGFAAESAASVVLLSAASMGAPVSTTHVITSCIMGVGSTRRLSAVRWGIGKKILYAWVLTLPACAIMAGAIYHALKLVLGA
ncbi:MAG: inorganic phosphate transporter [Thermodesulfobacteriota bacterium]